MKKWNFNSNIGNNLFSWNISFPEHNTLARKDGAKTLGPLNCSWKGQTVYELRIRFNKFSF